MLNIEEFTFKLQTILDYYGLTASAFADKIGVQRSSLSHLLSGRNKPSLEFVMKITDVFKEVDLYWLLQGKGEFPKSEEKVTSTPIMNNSKDYLLEEKLVSDKNETVENLIKQDNLESTSNIEQSPIEKIVIFYKNGTFKSYQPE